MKTYVVDQDQMEKLGKLYAELHAGSDRERDFGHRLWLICAEISAQEVEIDVERKMK